MIEQLVAALSSGLNLTSREIEDALWLAQHVSVGQTNDEASTSVETDQLKLPGPSSPIEKESTLEEGLTTKRGQPSHNQSSDINVGMAKSQNGSGGLNTSGIPVKISKAQSIRSPLSIAKSLKPLIRRVASGVSDEVDETATVDRMLRERICIPVMKSSSEPWFELAIVVDNSISMHLWQQTVDEVHRLMNHYGVFRNVRIWNLVIDESDEVRIKVRSKSSRASNLTHSPSELLDPIGRRLILIATDCISDIWKSKKVFAALKLWTDNGPVALVQMLPEWLWESTAIGFNSQVSLRSFVPGSSNQKLDARRLVTWDESNLSDGAKLPIVTLESESFLAWAEMMSAKGGVWVSGMVFEPSSSQRFESVPIQSKQRGQESAEALIQRFRAMASPLARQLAALLAAAPVISLPIVRIIRNRLLKKASQVQVAEVFLSGLVRPISKIQADVDADQVQYAFDDDVREVLLRAVPTSTVLAILRETSQHVADGLNCSVEDFLAVLNTPSQDEGLFKQSRSFARVSAQILSQLGGQYARAARELKRLYLNSSPSSRVSKGPMSERALLSCIKQARTESWEVLDLSEQELTDLPISIGQLVHLQNLKLNGNSFASLPEAIGQLTNLRLLDISSNQLSTLPEVISQLTNLQTLDISSNQLSALSEAIGYLTNLQTLNVSRNNLEDLPESIGQLTNLQILDTGSNRISSLPEFIGQLSNLRSLIFSDNQLSTLPEAIGYLTNLQTLNVSRNSLEDLPESIGQLTNLQILDTGSNRINSLPEFIGQLSNLRSLIFSDNQLSALPDVIAQLANLQSLDISGNFLSYLPEAIGQLSALHTLDLSENEISSLPNTMSGLTALKSLSVHSNQLTYLPDWFRMFDSLESLNLHGNPLPIPPEILGSLENPKNTNNPSTVLDYYFQLQEESGSAPLSEAKLIIIGEGGSGKTSLARKLADETYRLIPEEKSTEGIDVIRWDFPLPDGNTFHVNIWDFGGQEIYHATHQFFLTKRALYLLVADTRQEDTDFYYWLKIVELLSDSSPVIIIKNEKQNRQCEIDEGLFKSQFNNLKESFPTNLKDNRGLDKIKDAIRYHISKLPHVGNPLPKVWVRVRAALENYAQNCNTITLEQYCDICRQNGFTDKQQMLFLSSYLHDLGVCLHFQDDKLLKRTVILRPEWATTAVYKVADSDTVRQNMGRFTEADTAEIWSDRQYSDLRDELLQLMIRFKLAYKIPNQRENTPSNYIATQLLPISQPSYTWDKTNNLILRYRYDFMPKGILTRFIVETHPLIENQDHVWKNGVILADKWSRAQIIENYPKSEITIHVSGTNKKPLLEIIRHEFWKIHQSYERLDYKELIPCNCPECTGSNKPEFYPYDLLMKYIAKRRYNIECRASCEPVDVRRLISDISDQPLYENSTQNPSIHYGNIYHQYGSGDNVVGKKVRDDNID